MALLFSIDPEHPGDFSAEIRRRLPDRDVYAYPQIEDPAQVSYLVGYSLPENLFQNLPSLKVVFSSGAGADALLARSDLPDVPVVRMVDPDLTSLVSEFAVAQVLAWHRDLWTYRRQQDAAEWNPLPLRVARDRRVAVLGLGAIGMQVVKQLTVLGFDLVGWSRTPKDLEGVPTFAGPEGLRRTLERADILVSVLPLTSATRRLLNRAVLEILPRGAIVINVGRGPVLDEADLLALLKEGHLRGASLDVFETEPLPETHPLWRHPNVVVTPHVAGAIHAAAMADLVATQIKRFESGLALQHVVNRAAGY